LSNGYAEQAFVAELSGRYPISYGFWVVTRGRIDMRSLSGDRSQLSPQAWTREGIHRAEPRRDSLCPHVRAEILYDTRFDVWNRQI
jgi:hypothetical protein